MTDDAKKYVRDPGRVKDMAAGVVSGQIDPVELVEACFARMDEVEGAVQAWREPDRAGALAQAKARGAEARDGRIRGPLHGVPIAVKDVIDVAGLPTRAFSPTRANIEPARYDAQVVAMLREAGAVILGKAHTTEFAFYENVPPTRNPYDLTRTPGGSSAGSAALVASGMAPLALGTQTAGSVTRPAAYCGIGGFKPSKLAVSAAGVVPFAPAFDTIGTIGYTLADAVAGFMGMCPSHLRSMPAVPEAPKLVVLDDPCLEAAEAAVLDSIEHMATGWAAGGWNVRRAKSPVSFAEVRARHTLICEYEVGRAHPYLADAPEGDVSQRLRDAVRQGLAISDADYVDARGVLHGMTDHFWSTFNTDEVIVFPVAPGPAPEGMTTGDPQFIAPLTALDGPIANMPCGMVDGLPLGVQLAASPGLDLALAEWTCYLEAQSVV